MKTIFPLSLLISSLIFSSTSYAEVKPTYKLDSRIQHFTYTPDDVFIIKTKFGHSSLIQFEDGEIINDDGGLGMGDANGWSIGVKGNNIFFKPKENNIDTNMTVVTNKRTYSFYLKSINGNDVTYVARFKYPEIDDLKLDKKSETKKLMTLKSANIKNENGSNIFIDSRININYSKKGNNDISPNNIWDDNLFTYLKFDNAEDLPTVYKVLPDGSETLVNTHIKDNVLVVQEVVSILRLRLGRLVTDIRNNNKQQTIFNEQGTSEDNLIRTIK